MIGKWAQDSTSTKRESYTGIKDGGGGRLNGVKCYCGGGTGTKETCLSHVPIR